MHYSANFKVKGCNSFNTFWSIESYWTKQRCEPGVKLSTTQNSVKITPMNSDPESQCPLLPLNGPSSGWLLVSTLHFSHKEYCQFFKTLLWDYNIGFYIKGKPYFNRATVNCISQPSQYLTFTRHCRGLWSELTAFNLQFDERNNATDLLPPSTFLLTQNAETRHYRWWMRYASKCRYTNIQYQDRNAAENLNLNLCIYSSN